MKLLKILIMGTAKRVLLKSKEDERPLPSHLEKEMYLQLTHLKKQMEAITKILEIRNEK